jgi:hypothetical protein
MDFSSKTRTEQVLIVMYVLTWIAFIGILIKAGALMVAYGISVVNPVASSDLYKGLDLSKLREISFWHYTGFVSMMVFIYALKAEVLHRVIKIMSKVNLANPFTAEVARGLERISYTLVTLWVAGMLANGHTQWLEKRVGTLPENWATQEFLFMAGVVFIIAHMFKRGVELQSDADLTV